MGVSAGLRPRDAGPLVLLEREDLVKELAAVRERAESADRAEEAWVSNLVPKLTQLYAHEPLHRLDELLIHRCSSDGHAELLSLVYENAPVNTTPPFGPPSEARALQESVKAATEHLNAKVQRLEKVGCYVTHREFRSRITPFRYQETQLNERDKRKLTAFVEKWAR